MPRLDLRVEIRIRPVAFGVKLYDIFQRLEAPVVHVRTRPRDFAQCGRPELTIARALVDEPAIRHHVKERDSRVVELLVCEIRPEVASEAIQTVVLPTGGWIYYNYDTVTYPQATSIVCMTPFEVSGNTQMGVAFVAIRKSAAF
jgi:hypothetical protein